MIQTVRGMPMLVSAGALLIGLGAVGCGGSSGTRASTASTTAAGPAITKAEFVKRANAICARGNAANKAAGAKLGNQPSEAQVVAFVKAREVPAIQAQIDSIRALGAPAGEQSAVTSMLDLAQAGLEKVKSDPRTVYTGTDVFAAFARVAHPYGLTSCAPSS